MLTYSHLPGSVSSWMRCSVEVSLYLGSILGSMIFSIYGHGQPIGNSLFPPCLSLYKWTMRNSLSFYPSSESLVHDKFSIFNVSNLYNFLAKRYVGSIDTYNEVEEKNMKSYTWSSFSWSAQSCSTSCNKAAAFRLKRMLQAFFNPPPTTILLKQWEGLKICFG